MNTKWLRYGAFALIALVVLVGFGMWFWSLGAVAGETASVIQLVVKKAPVEARASSAAAWTSVDHSIELVPGAQVRTGTGAEAEILWGDRGVTRLDTNTQVTVEAMPADATQATGVDIKLRLEAGRIWSRMMKLLDIQSSFDVETRDVVATVRGTAFGVAVTARATEAAVTRSVVDLHSKDNLRSTLLREGEWGSFDGKGSPTMVRPLMETDAWALTNDELDQAFEQELLAEQRARMKRLAGAQIVGPDWLINFAEDSRLKLIGPPDRPALAEQYMLRHLARFIQDDDPDHLERIRTLSKRAEVRSETVLSHMRLALETEAKAPVELRELRGQLLLGRSSGAWYAEALNVDDDIDHLIFGSNSEESYNRLRTGVVASLEALESYALVISEFGANAEVDETVPVAELDQPIALSKLRALRRRLDLADSVHVSPVDGTPIEGEEAAEEGTPPPIIPRKPTVPKPTPLAPNSRVFQRLSLLVTPTETDLGVSVRVALYGIRADGTTSDLTSQSEIYPERSSDGVYGQGNFRPTVSGTIRLNAVYKDALGTRTTAASLLVRAAAPTSNVEGISFQFVGPVTVPCSTTVPFKVMARMLDGSLKDVTVSAKVSVENTKLFGVSDGKLLSFCSTTTQSTMVTATYNVGNVTKAASATVTVQPDPSPVNQPKSPNQPPTFNPNAQ
jgi:hypothetical protein